MPQPEAFTIGHSTHSLEGLVALLRRHEIEQVVDVRIAPGSRRYPHFAGDRLAADLPAAGIEYAHAKALGGRRRPVRGSPNTGWRNSGFRGYADYMQTAEFQSALHELERLAGDRRTAVMCAEGLWWRCHRRLIADALLARDWRVTHIDPQGGLHDHERTPFAEFDAGRVTYPAAEEQLRL